MRGANDPFFPSCAAGVFWKELPWLPLQPGICNVIAGCQTAISKWEKLCLRLRVLYESSVCVSVCVKNGLCELRETLCTFPRCVCVFFCVCGDRSVSYFALSKVVAFPCGFPQQSQTHTHTEAHTLRYLCLPPTQGPLVRQGGGGGGGWGVLQPCSGLSLSSGLPG